MKRLITTLFLCWICMSGYTQHDPGDGISGLGISITGLWNVFAGDYHGNILTQSVADDPVASMDGTFPVSVDALLPDNILMYKQFFQNGLAGRYGLCMSRISEQSTSSQFIASLLENKELTTDFSSFSFGFTAGIEKHMDEQSSKIDPYFGTDLSLSVLTGVKYNQSERISSIGVKGDSYVSNSEYSIEYPGGLGATLNLFVGFNYFVMEKISIGCEAGAGLGMVRIGGEWVSDYSGASTEGQSTATSTMFNNGNNESKITGLTLNSFGSINAIIYW